MDLVTWTGVFFSLLAANLGIPFPIQATYLLAANRIQNGQSYWLWLLLLTSGHLCGSMVAYAIGWWGEGYLVDRFRKRQGFARAHDAVHRWYERYGSYTVFATRFIGYVRPWSSLVAGFAHIKWQSFLVWTLLGSLLFNIISLEINVYFMDLWIHYGWWMRILLIALFLLSFTAIYWLQRLWRNYDYDR